MELIAATEKDVSLIQELARKSWEGAYSEILSQEQIDYMLGTMYSRDEIISQFGNPNYHYYLISDGSKVQGFMGYEHHYEPKTTKLHRIYLLPESKGKGLGKVSLEFLKVKTGHSGDERIILNVNKQNPAKKIYESQGFKVYDTGVFDIGSGFVMDDFLMEYILEK